jgi:hypothetical protein
MNKKRRSIEAITRRAGETKGNEPSPVATTAAAPSTTAKLTTYVSKATWRCLKIMAIDQDKAVNDLLREALDLLLAKYGEKSLAEWEKKAEK